MLSVFERPQRLLTYIQPTSPGARARPVHVGRIADPDLSPADFVLDREKGLRFLDALDGWIPGHEKIIYASYSGGSLTAFARRAVEGFGRGRVPGIVEDGFYLGDLESSLARSGAREGSVGFYLEAAARGVFFHFSGLSRETRRLMADGYRRFQPQPCEPFILCATETISYGVNLPADALFLENVSWPRSRYRHCYSIEALTSNEFRNLVGRVGRYGHIKPGVIPTVVVNWPLGRSINSAEEFSRRRGALAETASSSPASEIDCRDLQKHLLLPPAPRLADYPGPVARFYLLALLHASRAAGGVPVSPGEAAGFLSETYTVRSLFRGGGAEFRGGLLSGLAGFLHHLVRDFGGLVAQESRAPAAPGGSGRGAGRGGEGRGARPGRGSAPPARYLPAPLCLNLARNDTSPATLKELDRLLAGFGDGSAWDDPAFAGLKALLAVPLLAETRDVFSRVFSDPRMLPPGALRKARKEPAEAEGWFRGRAAPVEALLGEAGVPGPGAAEMTERIRAQGRQTLERHLRENYRGLAGSREVIACLRDAFLQKVLSTVQTLLMWIDGRSVKSIMAVAGSGLRSAAPGQPPEDGGDAGFPPGGGIPAEGGGIPASGGEGGDGAAEEGGPPARLLRGSVDTNSFNHRYCDKAALLMDSYLAYRQAAGDMPAGEAASLQLMAERVRWGLRAEDLGAFNRERRERGIGREEWLARERGVPEGGVEIRERGKA
ncbi:MAG: hypothetical protein LBG06_01780 [Deltaproteobacteria bacterium]|nr:hypothetical protein [Deltaproteobacteria bacterium]